jgi:hypothetical protein
LNAAFNDIPLTNGSQAIWGLEARQAFMKTSQVQILSRPSSGKLQALWAEAAPWLAGAGIAVGHAAVGANCTVPQQGRCGACGSCIVAVGALVGWALLKQHRGEGYYADKQKP